MLQCKPPAVAAGTPCMEGSAQQAWRGVVQQALERALQGSMWEQRGQAPPLCAAGAGAGVVGKHVGAVRGGPCLWVHPDASAAVSTI